MNAPPSTPATSVMSVSTGVITRQAMKRGTDRYWTGSADKGPEGVDLLRHLHGADLRRDGGAHPAGQEEAGEHRAELAEHGDGDARSR